MAQDFSHSSSQFLASIDAEIARLQLLRSHIADALGSGPAKIPAAKAKQPEGPARRGMSEEGRRKIAEAQKARWAKQKKAVKAPAKKVAAKQAFAKQAASKTVRKNAASKPSLKKAAAAKTTEQV